MCIGSAKIPPICKQGGFPSFFSAICKLLLCNFQKEALIKAVYSQTAIESILDFGVWPNKHIYLTRAQTTDPNEAFFHWNCKLLALDRQFVLINFWAFGLFSADFLAPILIPWVPCPCFPLINHYFYKKHKPQVYQLAVKRLTQTSLQICLHSRWNLMGNLNRYTVQSRVLTCLV